MAQTLRAQRLRKAEVRSYNEGSPDGFLSEATRAQGDSPDEIDEPVRRFLDQLDVSPETSVVEVNGKTVYLVVRPAERSGDAEEPWTDQKNHRRAELVDKSIPQTITPLEAVELDELTRQMRRYLDRVAPLPLYHIRELHDQLVKRARDSAI